MKKISILVLALICMLVTFVGCGKDVIKMSLDKVGDEVVYNRSMVGIGDIIGNNIKNVIDFTDADTKKMGYITNTVYYNSDTVKENITIEKGRYYEAFSDTESGKVCRGILVFLQFKDAESDVSAVETINQNMNKDKSEDGVFNLNLFGTVVKKNVIFVYYLRDVQAEYELRRVFSDNSYVK